MQILTIGFYQLFLLLLCVCGGLDVPNLSSVQGGFVLFDLVTSLLMAGGSGGLVLMRRNTSQSVLQDSAVFDAVWQDIVSHGADCDNLSAMKRAEELISYVNSLLSAASAGIP